MFPTKAPAQSIRLQRDVASAMKARYDPDLARRTMTLAQFNRATAIAAANAALSADCYVRGWSHGQLRATGEDAAADGRRPSGPNRSPVAPGRVREPDRERQKKVEAQGRRVSELVTVANGSAK